MNENHVRDYYIYLLEYEWYEPLAEALSIALRNNYEGMADASSRDNKSVIVMRTANGIHFNDDVLSYHNINGDDDPNLLPAILITNRHPAVFKKRAEGLLDKNEQDKLKLIIIPLRQYCRTTNDVVTLVRKLLSQIREGKDLDHFAITDVRSKGVKGALVDSITLTPTRRNIKVPLEEMLNFVGHTTNIMTINNTITNTISGSGNSVNVAAGKTVEQSNVVHIITSEEHQKLKELGVPDEKLNQLHDIQVTGAATNDTASTKTKVMHWFGEVSAHVVAIGLAHNVPAILETIQHMIK